MELSVFLDRLKLNRYEKDIILFLSGIDHAGAGEIYKNTKVPKGRIYSVLNDLVQKGFVNVIPTSPKKYRIEDTKASLKKYLEAQIANANKQIHEIDAIDSFSKKFNLDKHAPSVYYFTGREEHLNALLSLRNRAKNRMLQMAPLFIGTYSSNRALYSALERKVKVKIIIKEITKENRNNIRECLKLGAEIRIHKSEKLISCLIKDRDEFILGMDDYRNKEERLSILSRNEGLIDVL
ncbi:MAG: TrmB family transcriptional regulator, partial [Candidatus Nanoarchaeia archaeon]